MARTVLDARPSRWATCRAAALSHACPTASSNRLLKGALLGSCSTFSAFTPQSGHRTDTVPAPPSFGTQSRPSPALLAHTPHGSRSPDARSPNTRSSGCPACAAPTASAPWRPRRSPLGRLGNPATPESSSSRCLSNRRVYRETSLAENPVKSHTLPDSCAEPTFLTQED